MSGVCPIVVNAVALDFVDLMASTDLALCVCTCTRVGIVLEEPLSGSHSYYGIWTASGAPHLHILFTGHFSIVFIRSLISPEDPSEV